MSTRMYLTKPIQDRFWKHVNIKTDSECWDWKASVNNSGYGKFYVDGKVVSSHRMAWMLTHGEIDGLHILHNCDNPRCCNPSHLFIGTNADNVKDMHKKGRNAKRPHGKLTEAQVLEIRAKREKGATYKALASEYGLSTSGVWSACNPKSDIQEEPEPVMESRMEYTILEEYPKVKISECVPNSWNPNFQNDFQIQKLLTSIREFGFIDPITVREVDGHYEIIDGEHRWRAAQILHGTHINVVNLGVMADAVAQQLTLLLRLRGSDDEDKLSQLVVDLEAELGREYINKVLPYSPDRISTLLDRIQFSPDQFGDFDPDDYWIDYNVSIPEGLYDDILKEFERIGRISEFRASMEEDVKRGLILERICALSSDMVIKE